MAADSIVYLFDVDNTLLDNDAVARDLRAPPDRAVRRRPAAALLGDLRAAPHRARLRRLPRRAAALPRRPSARRAHARDVRCLIDYPFADRLYPRALDVVARVRARGRPVILSDGDVVFQPRKIERSGLWEAFDGDVLVYIHKEQMLDDVERRYPASAT